MNLKKLLIIGTIFIFGGVCFTMKIFGKSFLFIEGKLEPICNKLEKEWMVE